MAHAKGPLMSGQAMGTIGNALVYSTWKGKTRVKKYYVPKNPRTEIQQYQRYLLRIAVSSWQGLTDEQKESYQQEAIEKQLKMSGYNYFLRSFIDKMKLYYSPTENLTVKYPFAEGQGTQVEDYSGNSIHGTWYGTGTHWDTGKVGPYSGKFNGTNDYVGIGNNLGLKDSSFSFLFWVKRDTYNRWDMVVCGTVDAGENKCIQIGFRSNNVFTFDFYGNWLRTVTTFTDGKWHMFATTFNVTNKKRYIYYDGNPLVNDTSPSNYLGTSPVTISAILWSTWMKGNVDFFLAYNRVLEAAEILDLYNRTK